MPARGTRASGRGEWQGNKLYADGPEHRQPGQEAGVWLQEGRGGGGWGDSEAGRPAYPPQPRGRNGAAQHVETPRERREGVGGEHGAGDGAGSLDGRVRVREAEAWEGQQDMAGVEELVADGLLRP